MFTTCNSGKIELNIRLPPDNAYRYQLISWYWQRGSLLTNNNSLWGAHVFTLCMTLSWVIITPFSITSSSWCELQKDKHIQLEIRLKPTYIFCKQVFGILDPGICVQPWLTGGQQPAALPSFLEPSSGVQRLKPYQSPYKEVDIDSK